MSEHEVDDEFSPSPHEPTVDSVCADLKIFAETITHETSELQEVHLKDYTRTEQIHHLVQKMHLTCGHYNSIIENLQVSKPDHNTYVHTINAFVHQRCNRFALHPHEYAD